MRRLGFVAPMAAAALLTSAGCFTMTNAKSAKVVSPGVALNVGGTMLEDTAAAMVETRLGLIPSWDLGFKMEALCSTIDTRLQFLDEERHSIDMAAELGVGMGLFVRPFTYGGVAVSKDFGSINPYCLLRFVEMGGIHEDDINDPDAPNIAELIIAYVPPVLENFVEIFFGAEIELGRNASLVPEIMWAPSLNEDGPPMTVFNLALMFKLGRVE